jgi:pyruvate formate lyase activating enzyme
MKMVIAGFLENSLIDYPGKIAVIAFTLGCNYKCPSCHAKQIANGRESIPEQDIFAYLNDRKEWVDGIVISGGEPTSRADLILLLRKLRGEFPELGIKLDTNGSHFSALESFLDEKLVDYLALDVKGPLRLYAQLAGKEYIDERDGIGKSIALAPCFPDYEYRTTCVPLFEDGGMPLFDNGKMRFMTAEELGDTAKFIYDWTGDNRHKYFLQKFVARSSEEMLDKRFAKENLPKEFWETPDVLLEEGLEMARKYLPNTMIRGEEK